MQCKVAEKYTKQQYLLHFSFFFLFFLYRDAIYFELRTIYEKKLRTYTCVVNTNGIYVPLVSTFQRMPHAHRLFDNGMLTLPILLGEDK